MVDQAEFDVIADHLRGNGVRPSVSKMRRELPKGGSPRAVSTALKTWMRSREISEWQVDAGLPADIQAKVDAAAVSLWEAARDKEAAAFNRERDALKAQSAAVEQRLADATVRLADAERRLQEQAAEIAVLKDQAARAKIHQDRRSREFWDRLMWNIGEMLEVSGPMKPSEIVNKIPADLRREAAHHAEKLIPSRLKKKLDDRDEGEQYVVELPDGRWDKRVD